MFKFFERLPSFWKIIMSLGANGPTKAGLERIFIEDMDSSSNV